jgi:hypothetical protein
MKFLVPHAVEETWVSKLFYFRTFGGRPLA